MNRRRFLRTVTEPISEWNHDKHKIGFIDPVVHLLLVILTLLSPHHWLQSTPDLGRIDRYVKTDIYFLSWALFALLSFLCAGGGWCTPAPKPITVLIWWRLVEAISRELWIILYRRKPLTPAPRVLVVALVNYATITGLFGYLYAQGEIGFKKAASISLTFSPPEGMPRGAMETAQSVYCLLFIIIIFATFVARVRLIERR